MTKKPLTEAEVIALGIKNWLKCSEVARLLQVSESTVKNLWRSGRLTYRCANTKQRTRKSSMSMIRDYQRREMSWKIR